MRILLMNDKGFSDLGRVADYLREMSSNFIRSSQVQVTDSVISYPVSHKRIVNSLKNERDGFDCIIVYTHKPYDNNYFYMDMESNRKGEAVVVVVSMYGWNRLTDVDMMNGVVYMYCSIIRERIGEFRHETTTGCLNDFLWDKTGVDIGMKMASFCNTCRSKFGEQISSLDITGILDDLSVSSRNDQNILDYWTTRSKSTNINGNSKSRQSQAAKIYDVFLCHNSNDKPAIRDVYQRLTSMGFSPWFDEFTIPPGVLWQEELEKAISSVKSVAVFVGENNIGPWHNAEMRAFLNEFATRQCPVIPVILPNCNTVPQLPLFLRNFMWVDLRSINPDPWQRLAIGIAGNVGNSGIGVRGTPYCT